MLSFACLIFEQERGTEYWVFRYSGIRVLGIG
jgi:hypothetical protein